MALFHRMVLDQKRDAEPTVVIGKAHGVSLLVGGARWKSTLRIKAVEEFS